MHITLIVRVFHCAYTGTSYMSRELWYRASLAWRTILETPEDCDTLLVVAHNAVNQALIATALGLPATYFRRLLQSNAAVSVLDLQPTLTVNPRVTVDRLNQVGDDVTMARNVYTPLVVSPRPNTLHKAPPIKHSRQIGRLQHKVRDARQWRASCWCGIAPPVARTMG